jgi:hypothetical protein
MVELWCEGDDGNCLVQGGPVHLLHALIACLRAPATSIVFLLAVLKSNAENSFLT